MDEWFVDHEIPRIKFGATAGAAAGCPSPAMGNSQSEPTTGSESARSRSDSGASDTPPTLSDEKSPSKLSTLQHHTIGLDESHTHAHEADDTRDACIDAGISRIVAMQASLIRLDHVCDGMPSLQSSVKDAAATMAHDLRSDLDDSKTPADLLLLPPNCRVTFNGTTDELTDALAPAVATTYETYVPLKKLVADLPRKILSINDAYDSRERTRLTLQVDRPCGERVRRRGGGARY